MAGSYDPYGRDASGGVATRRHPVSVSLSGGLLQPPGVPPYHAAETWVNLQVATGDLLVRGIDLAYAQQDLATLQGQQAQTQAERAQEQQQLFELQNNNNLLEIQLQASETQRLAAIQNIAEMQTQVMDLEIEVEVWQALAQHPPAPPEAEQAPPDELQGHSGLDEESFAGPPSPASPTPSVGSAAD